MIPRNEVPDITVKIGNDEFYLIQFPVGDWSDDGHGKCYYFTVSSKKPTKDVREAHFRAKDYLGFDIGDICGEYEEGKLNGEIVKNLEELGFDFSDKTFDKDKGEIFPGQDGILKIWTFLLNKVDPSLELKSLEIPEIAFYGFDSQNRHLRNPGYGTFV